MEITLDLELFFFLFHLTVFWFNDQHPLSPGKIQVLPGRNVGQMDYCITPTFRELHKLIYSLLYVMMPEINISSFLSSDVFKLLLQVLYTATKTTERCISTACKPNRCPEDHYHYYHVLGKHSKGIT